jgi:hypothetical protein
VAHGCVGTMGTLYTLVLPLRFLGDVWRLPALLRMPLWWLVRLRRQRKGTTPSAMSSCIAYRQKQKGGSFSKCAYIATPGTRFGPKFCAEPCAITPRGGCGCWPTAGAGVWVGGVGGGGGVGARRPQAPVGGRQRSSTTNALRSFPLNQPPPFS